MVFFELIGVKDKYERKYAIFVENPTPSSTTSTPSTGGSSNTSSVAGGNNPGKDSSTSSSTSSSKAATYSIVVLENGRDGVLLGGDEVNHQSSRQYMAKYHRKGLLYHYSLFIILSNIICSILFQRKKETKLPWEHLFLIETQIAIPRPVISIIVITTTTIILPFHPSSILCLGLSIECSPRRQVNKIYFHIYIYNRFIRNLIAFAYYLNILGEGKVVLYYDLNNQLLSYSKDQFALDTDSNNSLQFLNDETVLQV